MAADNAPEQGANDITAEKFRNVLSHWPTGVSLISFTDEQAGPVGVIIGSFCSISVEPPLVAFSLMKSAWSLEKLREAGRFCVNVLSADQADVVDIFCKEKPEERFDRVSYRMSPAGLPILTEAIACIEADIECEYDGGDHTILIGRVNTLTNAARGRPLIFAQGNLGTYQTLDLCAS